MPDESLPSPPLVSIGMPVYNGAEYLERALTHLVAQDHPHVELIISDNASTDRTPEICARFAARYPHIRYVRNSKNIGPQANFMRLATLHARGKYFMWAAHDDMWSCNYVSSLVALLEAQPDAVLATASATFLKQDGTPSRNSRDRQAPGTSRFDNIRLFLTDDACAWVYGLFRTEWIRQHAPRLAKNPLWRGDLAWLFETLLRFPVVGSPRAVIYGMVTDGYYRPRSERDFMAGWIRVFRHLTRVCFDHAQGWERLVALRYAWYYCYRKYVRRGNPIHTVLRIVKLLALWSFYLLTSGPIAERTVADDVPVDASDISPADLRESHAPAA